MFFPHDNPTSSNRKRKAPPSDNQTQYARDPPHREDRQQSRNWPEPDSEKKSIGNFQHLAQYRGDLRRADTQQSHTTHPNDRGRDGKAQHSTEKTSYNYTETWGHKNHQTLQAQHETRKQHATAPVKYECNERRNSSNNPARTHRRPKYYAHKPSLMPYYMWQGIHIEQQWATDRERRNAMRTTGQAPMLCFELVVLLV